MPNGQKPGFASDEYRVYQDGKARRYALLFSVNGGALAILEFATEVSLGSLFSAMPYGLILFTAVMFIDIWAFGSALHDEVEQAFGPIGRFVLTTICGLIIAAWCLMALQQWSLLDQTPAQGLVVRTLLALLFSGLVLWLAWQLQEILKRSDKRKLCGAKAGGDTNRQLPDRSHGVGPPG
jgi:FtsH-binding integral membrane protein